MIKRLKANDATISRSFLLGLKSVGKPSFTVDKGGQQLWAKQLKFCIELRLLTFMVLEDGILYIFTKLGNKVLSLV